MTAGSRDFVKDFSGSALQELADYLTIFEEASQPGLTFDLSDDALAISFAGERLGVWRQNGEMLTFFGAHTSHVSTLHGAVLHTLGTLADVLGMEAAAAA